MLGPLLLLLLLAGTVVGANDPGHDTLYVLKVGDNMTGSLNLTGSVTASYLRTASLIYGNYLDIWANGTLETVTSRPAIQAPNGASLYLDSTQNIYIATLGGTTGTVQFGPPGAGNPITVNVSGQLLQQNIPVCLADGTHCPGSLSSANITGSGTANYVTKWTSTTNLGTSSLYDDGTNVGIGTTIPTATLTVNSSAAGGSFLVQNTTGSNHFFVNGTTGFVGVGTTAAFDALSVNGTVNASGNVYENGNRVCTSYNGLCGSGGANVSGSGGANYVAVWSNTTSLTTGILWENTTNVGIGTATPTQTLDVNGGINLSGTAYIASTNLTSLQISENGNLYYTDTRAAASVQNSTLLRNSTNAAFNNLTTNNLTVTGTGYIASTNLTSLQIGENGNLYYTDARVAAAIQNTTILRNNTNANFNTLNTNALNVGTTNLTCSQVNGCVVGAITSTPYQSSAAGWTNTTLTTTTALNVNVTNGNLTVVNGNVGIGTTTPTQKLDVAGNVNISTASSCIYVPGGGRLCGNTTCSTLYSPNGVTVMEACN